MRWIERNFYIPETKLDPKLKGRIGLEDYQRDALREALSRDENGNLKYSIVMWSDIKKSAKSTLAAAVNLYKALHTEWSEQYVIANDLKQADSRVAHYLRRAIQISPELRHKCKVSGYRIVVPSGSFIEAIPIDPSGEAGSNADMLTWSELWGANEGAKQNMWAEMTLSPTKHGQSQRWVESYAGFTQESLLLYSLYELGVKKGKMLWPDKLYNVTEGAPTPLELYVNEDARMLCLWNTQPRCTWQTRAYYKSEAQILTPNQFDRMHRNQWVSSSESFIPAEWWDACRRDPATWPKYDQKRQSMIIALDAGVSNDNFGLWMGCRHPELKDEILTVYSQKWVPPTGGKIDYQGTEEHPGPERVVDKLVKEYNIVQVCYDSYQLHDMSMRHKQKGEAWWRSFSQGNDRLLADSQIQKLIKERRFWHRGEPDFREHVLNADAKIDEEDRKIRIVKRADNLKIDILVAASMGSFELLRLNL